MATHSGPETILQLMPGDNILFNKDGREYRYWLGDGAEYLGNKADYNRKILDDIFGRSGGMTYLRVMYESVGLSMGNGDWPEIVGGTIEERVAVMRLVVLGIYEKLGLTISTKDMPEPPKIQDWKKQKKAIEDALWDGESGNDVIKRVSRECGYVDAFGRVIRTEYYPLSEFVRGITPNIPTPPR